MKQTKMKRSFRTQIAIAAITAALGASASSLAHAQLTGAQRVSFRLEGGVGTMLSEFQTNRDPQRNLGVVYGYGLGFGGSARLGFSLIEILAIQGSFGTYMFPQDGGTFGSSMSVTGGLRLEPSFGHFIRPWVDGNVGASFTGPLLRLTYDFGLGVEFLFANEMVGIGPMGRFLVVNQPDTAADGTAERWPDDALFWNAGLSVTLRAPRTAAPVAIVDQDQDGITDADDLCPTEPLGAHPDPARNGCPLHDGDNDGVADGDDVCPTEPAGATPDPARRGCPILDTDHDGVADPVDQCPTVACGPSPDAARPGCADGDDDSDSIRNGLDQCRAQHQGAHPDPAREGCPAPDRDNDQIADPVDHCPDQPGAPHPDPNRNGCPGLVRIERGQLRIVTPVFFATRRDAILPRSFAVLQAVADALAMATDINRVSIEGHTDDVGNDAANMTLSERRASSVMTWLTAHGIAASRLEAHGFGETRPLSPGRSSAIRAGNRRVEFQIRTVNGQPFNATP